MEKKDDANSPELIISHGAATRQAQTKRSVLFLRPRRVRDGEPDEGDMPDMPVVRVSAPDVAVQLRQAARTCPPQDEVEADAQALGNLIRRVISGVEVRSRCDDASRGAVETFGVWLDPSTSRAESTARNEALGRIGLLDPNESYGIFVKARAIDAVANAQLRSIGDRLSANGARQTDGPIHLQRLYVEIDPPERMITRVEGFDDRPWPDVGFTASIVDTLNVGSVSIDCLGSPITDTDVICTSSPMQVDINEGDAALAAFLGLFTLPLPGLIGGYFLFELYQAATSGGVGGSQEEGGVGCGLLKLAHTPIPRPGRGTAGSKLIPAFARKTLDHNGLFLSGQRLLCIRQPVVRIDGPESLSAPANARNIMARYSAVVVDSFGTLQFRWSVDDGVVEHPSAPSTRITFAADGAGARTTVRLVVTDADGAIPQVTRRVTIRSAAPPTPRPGRPSRQPT